ncbi:hypothetical protein [Nonomuraea diastatica]|uniref:Uncharacterized protein n=1 Tax=Nonomuraea diastatica TaxID=1848329 RepID=A0A4R4WG46_9ACTN|nr:hypothetical protein [Nonomuraea diastatica]TDD17969.1 hypothetical protein E1294_26070 [Nonomuraea diastatica]
MSRVVKVRAGNTLVEAEIHADLPLTGDAPDRLTSEREYESTAAARFTVPIEDLARKALATLE